MPEYRIITDTCSDLSKALYDQLDVDYASLSVRYGTDTYPSFTEEDDLKSFYAQLRAGEFPGTVGVNPTAWKEVMRPILEAGQDILCIAFSSAMSTTCQSAIIAAAELADKFPHRVIRVVDSLCFSTGQALLLWHACQRRDAGWDLEKVAAWCESNKLHVCHWLAMDSLVHLKKGGRIPADTHFPGAMLKMKPLFTITNEGRFSAPQKARGWKGAMDTMIKHFQKDGQEFDNRTVCIGHGDNLADAETLAQRLREECGVENVIISCIGGVIGAHTGPDTIALYYLGKQR